MPPPSVCSQRPCFESRARLRPLPPLAQSVDQARLAPGIRPGNPGRLHHAIGRECYYETVWRLMHLAAVGEQIPMVSGIPMLSTSTGGLTSPSSIISALSLER